LNYKLRGGYPNYDEGGFGDGGVTGKVCKQTNRRIDKYVDLYLG